MASINLIKASDGTGNASTATVQTVRNSGVTTIIVDTVNNIPATFMGSMGTPHTFVDPVTSEEITVISEATAVDFTGHVSGANLEIDSIAPGYTDLGSAVGDIIVIRPTTDWANNLADTLAASHDNDGTLKAGAVDVAAVLASDVVTTAKIAAGAATPDKQTAITWTNTMTTVVPISTSWQNAASLVMPATTVAHKYLINVTFNFTGISAVETTARIAEGTTSIRQSYINPSSAAFSPLPLTAIYTSPALGGQTINLQVSRTSGSGGTLDGTWSHYSIVDLGRA